ncbi:modification methylase DdeI [Pyricularia oryzae]|nr:modification methylase DdeI [Pyricularia oryzae]
MPPFLEDWADELGMSPWYDDESADELPDAPADITLSPQKVSPNRLEGSFLGHRPSSQPRPTPDGIRRAPDRDPTEILGWSSPPAPTRDFSTTISESDAGSQSDAEELPSDTSVKQDSLVSVELPPSTLSIPSSMYKIYDPETEQCTKAQVPITEGRALDILERQARLKAKHDAKAEEEDEDEIYLDDFAFYTLAHRHKYELCGLQDLFKIGNTTLYFNGWLTRGNSKYYLESVPFGWCSIGNYGLDSPSIDGAVWIQSKLQSRKKAGAWYKLRNPGFEYVRLYKPFLWLADLAKHVINFIENKISKRVVPENIGIHSFRSEFASWLDHVHGLSPAFKAWFDQHPMKDFRSDVAVHAEFLWKEANGVLEPKVCRSLRLFKEVLTLDQYRAQEGKDNLTVVTPYVYDLFRHMESGHLLKKVNPTEQLTLAGTGKEAGSVPNGRNDDTRHVTLDRKTLIDNIRIGDVISRKPDGEGSKWKKGHGNTRWFGLVQQVVKPSRGETRFHIKWLYSPHDTPCNRGTYPWPNELFLSLNHCSCHRRGDDPFLASEILAKHSVAWSGDEKSSDEFFVRQSYDNEERRWITLQKSHMFCDEEAQPIKYEIGETVLAGDKSRLEPYVITGFFEHGTANFRRLSRRAEVDPSSSAPPNELIYTEEIIRLPASDIRSPCTIRVFTNNPQVIPTPYDRRGTGNCFFIRFKLETDASLVAMTEVPPIFKQGFLPQKQGRRKSKPKPLRGLDLFAGCGNLGRGIEEGGAVEVKWVNDIWTNAIHTYMANTNDKSAVKPFLGSVDLLLEKALKRDGSVLDGSVLDGSVLDGSVPSRGEVEFISGGSPCQGFSLLTVNKSDDRQVKNRSLVASFASFVDFYRPKYGLLENVTNMVNANVRPDCDYLSQLFCALVGLGYQVQIILGDAWSYGAPQQRSRIFLSFARADFQLPQIPTRSHSHTAAIPSRAIGYLNNGERFVERQFSSTAFRYVTSGEAIDDLPKIGDGRQICIPFPDHRPNKESFVAQVRIAHIPVTPYGIGFVQAYQTGRITEAERQIFPADTLTAERTRCGRGWSRLSPNKLFQTITTTPNHTDSRTGCQIHPSEQRTLTIMEVRRAQGVPDNEVLVGQFRDRWKLVGNSVARQAALALGLELRRAYFGNLYDDDDDEDAAAQAVVSIEGDLQVPLHPAIQPALGTETEEPRLAPVHVATVANGTLETGSHKLSAAVSMTPGGATLSAQVRSQGVRAIATATIDLTIEDDASDMQSVTSSQWKRKLDEILIDSDNESDAARVHPLKLSKLSHY